MDREAWQDMVHGVPKSWTQLSTCTRAHTHTHTHTRDGLKKRGSGPESEQWQRSWREGDGWPDYM